MPGIPVPVDNYMGQMNGNKENMGQPEPQSPLKQAYASGIFGPPPSQQQQQQQPPLRASRAGLSHSVSVANLPKDNRHSVSANQVKIFFYTKEP